MLRDEPFAQLDAATLYALLRLRVDVFVVEQACPYAELDGRDLEPRTRHVWWDEGGAPLAYLRVLDEGDAGVRIGRVATAPRARGRGLAGRLVRHAIRAAHRRDVVLDAQAHLEAWYRSLGFRTVGPAFVEDGIPHVPMHRYASGVVPP